MERKLASIQRILEILPIENADAIELAVVNGWKVVVAKSENFKPGDQVIYCEIDSFLPVCKEFEFLRKSSYKKMADGSEGFRLRTIKLRGQISQGLVVPLKVIYTICNKKVPKTFEWDDGQDVTDLLGIVKYEPPIPAELAGKVKGNFPGFLKKTDEERIQNLVSDYETMKMQKYYKTEKVDGASVTYYLKDGNFGVCTRNLELSEPEPFVEGEMVMCKDGSEKPKKENSLWKMAKTLNLKEKMLSLGINIAFQGNCSVKGSRVTLTE